MFTSVVLDINFHSIQRIKCNPWSYYSMTEIKTIANNNYRATIKWFIDTHRKVLNGQIIADEGLTIVNLPVTLTFSDQNDLTENYQVITDLSGGFTYAYQVDLTAYNITAEVILATPEGGVLTISSKIIQADLPDKIFMITEKIHHYLITEQGDYFINELNNK